MRKTSLMLFCSVSVRQSNAFVLPDVSLLSRGCWQPRHFSLQTSFITSRSSTKNRRQMLLLPSVNPILEIFKVTFSVSGSSEHLSYGVFLEKLNTSTVWSPGWRPFSYSSQSCKDCTVLCMNLNSFIFRRLLMSTNTRIFSQMLWILGKQTELVWFWPDVCIPLKHLFSTNEQQLAASFLSVIMVLFLYHKHHLVILISCYMPSVFPACSNTCHLSPHWLVAEFVSSFIYSLWNTGTWG